MQPIIYDVAVSIDGYISGPEGDISQFPQSGEIVEDYSARLATYSVAIMGKHTYEFGYLYGLKPGENPYGHMQTWVFSQSLQLPDDKAVMHHSALDLELIHTLRTEADGPIYLCGGGEFAGSLLAKGLIDKLRLKRAPVVLGGGVRLFGQASVSPRLRHIDTREYKGGAVLQEFAIDY